VRSGVVGGSARIEPAAAAASVARSSARIIVIGGAEERNCKLWKDFAKVLQKKFRKVISYFTKILRIFQ
jgi:hypothetical protein